MLRRIWTAGVLLLGLQLGFVGRASAQAPDTAQADSIAEQPKKLNPYTGDEEKIAEGRKLFLRWNCYSCHGVRGGGGIGRPTNDEEWIYGGDDASVLESIKEGTPGGMPAFAERMSEDETWKVIAYMRSYYKGDPYTVSWAARGSATEPATGTAAAAAAVSGEAVGEVSSTADAPEKLNPYTGDAEKVAEGRKLFLKYNCYGCHGTLGGGGIGRPLNDEQWIYGGDDARVVRTIQGGRPGGMPVFQERISKDEIWKIIAYVRSFYRGGPAKIAW